MRTRTLLLLAVACGLVILVAGTVQLLRLSDQDEATAAYDVGDTVPVGDLTVVVESFAENDGEAVVGLTTSGVDDPDGTAEFRLVVPGESLVVTSRGADACGVTTVAPVRCTLTFDVATVEGTSRTLVYRRGDDIVRWVLRDD